MINALKLSKALAVSSPETVVDMLKGYQEEMLSRGEAVKRSRAAAGGDDSSRFVWGQPMRPGPGLDRLLIEGLSGKLAIVDESQSSRLLPGPPLANVSSNMELVH